MREIIESKVKLAPENPGVYIFKGKKRINYIGKAKNLKHRLYQHLQYYDKDARERSMIDKSIDIEWIVTSNEYEALVLEIDLIQTHKPLYNRLHRYGSGYPMILLTEDDYPTVKVVRGTDHKGILYGPFIYMGRAYKIKKLIHKTFKLRTCDPLVKRTEPCMDYHLGLCSAPCTDYVNKDEYMLQVEAAKAMLSGELGDILEKLYVKMEEFSKSMMFEKAAQVRDQIIALQNIARGQKVSKLPYKEADIFYLMGCRMGLFFIRNSKLIGKEIVDLDKTEDVEEVFLGYYYKNPVAERIFCNFEIDENIVKWLSERSGREIKIEDEIDEGICRIIEENMKRDIDHEIIEKTFKDVLNMEPPDIIEGFDISHFYGEETVGSCVVWEKGEMNKRRYRRYKVKSIKDIDDYSALKEVLERRAMRIISGEEKKPDVWLIDGGKGQLNVGISVRNKYGLDIKVMALAKQEETLFTEDGREINLREYPVLYSIFGFIRDEAHRFALFYNRKLRSKRTMEEILDNIKGIGEVKKRIIYNTFESLYDLAEAREEELRRLGLPLSLKQEIKKYLEQPQHSRNPEIS